MQAWRLAASATSIGSQRTGVDAADRHQDVALWWQARSNSTTGAPAWHAGVYDTNTMGFRRHVQATSCDDATPRRGASILPTAPGQRPEC